MLTYIVSCQDLCRRTCAFVSTKHGDAQVAGLDQVNGDDMTPLMTAVAAGNEEMAFELAWALVALYGREISNTA